MVTILFLSANPAMTKPLDLEEECNGIKEQLQYAAGKAGVKNIFKVEQRHEISIRELIRQIQNYDPQIIHFSGHGSPENALIFKNENTGQSEEVPQSKLSDLFEILVKEIDIDLVFLNACFSEKQASGIGNHIKCVIGMSDAIPDQTAKEFAVTFYSSLGFGRSIKNAFDLAMAQLGLLSLSGDKIPRLIVKEGVDASKIFVGENERKSLSQINDNKQVAHQIKDTANYGNITVGDISGATGVIIGNKIKTGDVIIGIDQSIRQNPQNEYLQALKDLTDKLEEKYKEENISDEKKTEINKSILALQEDVKDLKPGTKIDDLSPIQQDKIKSDTSSLIDKILDTSPVIAETIIKFTPLAPFDNLIHQGVQKIVDGIKKWRESKSTP